MPQLSVVIITFNEERNIARCIDSVKGIADDIVVVDSFSKDKTKEIAESKGARVVMHEFPGHIEQKNILLFFRSMPMKHCRKSYRNQYFRQRITNSMMVIP